VSGGEGSLEEGEERLAEVDEEMRRKREGKEDK
jgi:hypothetical protein